MAIKKRKRSCKPSVVIIGGGRIGCAIGKIVARKGIKPLFWDIEPTKTPHRKPLAEIVPSADFLFLCTPSWALPDVLAGIRPHVVKTTVVISLAKGICGERRNTVDELLERFLPDHQPFALLSGPMLAEELSKGLAGIGVVATARKAIYRKTALLFHGTNLLVEYSANVRGVALSGVLKNIYALALGIADGLKWGSNQKGWLIAKALREMTKIEQRLGDSKDTVSGTAGLGDLVATGFSPYSRNRQAGEELIKTGRANKSEGMSALTSVLFLLKEKKSELPLLLALEEAVIKRQPAKIVFERLQSFND
ncbi:hypothetical protein HY479_03655 [Candidatus Uhrbacteria bacterium]|nr:hypothetical protein [Candidatus Uhrbacteria bacterium]